MTTVGSVAWMTDFWKASGSRTCNILLAFTPSEGDKASHVEFRGSAFAPTQRHIRGPPDTRPLFRSSKGWNGFACRFRGGPLLFPGTRVAGRSDVRGGPCRAGPRIRSGAGRGDPSHGRPGIPGGATAGRLRGRRCRPTDPRAGEGSRSGGTRDPRGERDGRAARREQGEGRRTGGPWRPRDLDGRNPRRAPRRARHAEDQTEPGRHIVRRLVVCRTDSFGGGNRPSPQRPHRGRRSARTRYRPIPTRPGGGRALQRGNPPLQAGPTPPVQTNRGGDLAHRLELPRGDQRRRDGGRGDQRLPRPPPNRDESDSRRRVPRHRGRNVPQGTQDPETRAKVAD